MTCAEFNELMVLSRDFTETESEAVVHHLDECSVHRKADDDAHTYIKNMLRSYIAGRPLH